MAVIHSKKKTRRPCN